MRLEGVEMENRKSWYKIEEEMLNTADDFGWPI